MKEIIYTLAKLFPEQLAKVGNLIHELGYQEQAEKALFHLFEAEYYIIKNMDSTNLDIETLEFILSNFKL